jgi:hypothetical protein
MKKLLVKMLVFAGAFAFGMFLANVVHASSGPKEDKGTLWKIEGNGIQTSYLFGTIHVVGKSDFVLSEKAEELLMESDNLVLELDMDDPTFQMQMMQHAGMKGEYGLSTLLSKEEYQLVEAQVQKVIGAGLAPFESMKPFVVTSMLYPLIIGEEVASYELSLIQLAAEQQKEVLGLETLEYQFSIFDKIPYEQQADELVETVAETKKMSEMFSKLVDLYKSGDLLALKNEVYSYYENPQYGKWLLDDRNENWVSRIAELSKEQSNFYAVGAGHLGGEMGVINLLRRAGYKVTAVKQ